MARVLPLKIDSQTQPAGAGEAVEINNPALDNIRTGSALKGDAQHAFNDIIDNYAGEAIKFTLEGGDGVKRSLYQLEGSLNGRKVFLNGLLIRIQAKE